MNSQIISSLRLTGADIRGKYQRPHSTGATPEGPHPQFDMINFGDGHSLAQQQIAEIESYVLHLNGVDRAQQKIKEMVLATIYSKKQNYR